MPIPRLELRSLTWRDAEELVARGWEVGSHTVSHQLLTRVDDEQLHEELASSRSVVERQLGRCTAIAYPYGQADERVAEAASVAGYDVGCTLTFAHVVDEPLRRPRTGMGPGASRTAMATRVSRLGQAARRSRAARLARAMRRRRPWLPDG